MTKRFKLEDECLFDRLPVEIMTHCMGFVTEQHEQMALLAAFPHLSGNIDWTCLYDKTYTPLRCGLEEILTQHLPTRSEQLNMLKSCMKRGHMPYFFAPYLDSPEMLQNNLEFVEDLTFFHRHEEVDPVEATSRDLELRTLFDIIDDLMKFDYSLGRVSDEEIMRGFYESRTFPSLV